MDDLTDPSSHVQSHDPPKCGCRPGHPCPSLRAELEADGLLVIDSPAPQQWGPWRLSADGNQLYDALACPEGPRADQVVGMLRHAALGWPENMRARLAAERPADLDAFDAAVAAMKADGRPCTCRACMEDLARATAKRLGGGVRNLVEAAATDLKMLLVTIASAPSPAVLREHIELTARMVQLKLASARDRAGAPS